MLVPLKSIHVNSLCTPAYILYFHNLQSIQFHLGGFLCRQLPFKVSFGSVVCPLKNYFKGLCARRKLCVSVIMKQYEDAGFVDWQAICHLNLMICLTSLLDIRSVICAHMLYYCYYHRVNEIYSHGKLNVMDHCVTLP